MKKGKKKKKLTAGPLLTKHTEFKERVGSLCQCWTVGLANDPLVVVLRAQIQGEGAAHWDATKWSLFGRLVHSLEPRRQNRVQQKPN